MACRRQSPSYCAARKWLECFEAVGEAGLVDRSSRPSKTRSTIDEKLRAQIERLRRARMPMRTIAQVVGRSVAIISRVLAVLGLSNLKALDPVKPTALPARRTR